MDIKFVQCNTNNYKKGRTSPIKYIAIHYTANNGDTAKNNADYYKNNYVGVSAHYFVDEGNVIYQSVSDGDTAWAVGGTLKYTHPECRNANSISIEMCSRNKNGNGRPANDNGWYFKEETINNAAKLTKELMLKYNIPVENVIRHYDVWGKICPAPFVNNSQEWERFKSMLKTNKYSYDNTVDNMICDGVITTDNMIYWERILRGEEVARPEYVRTLLDRYHSKMK